MFVQLSLFLIETFQKEGREEKGRAGTPAFLIPSFRHPSSFDHVFRMYRLFCMLITRGKWDSNGLRLHLVSCPGHTIGP